MLGFERAQSTLFQRRQKSFGIAQLELQRPSSSQRYFDVANPRGPVLSLNDFVSRNRSFKTINLG